MLKRIICIALILSFSFTSVFARTTPNPADVEKLLTTSQGKEILNKYNVPVNIKAEDNSAVTELEQSDDKADKVVERKNKKDKKIILSELEKALSADLIEQGKTSLRLYGHDAFRNTIATFSPLEDVPIGPDYIIGPGDSFNITLWGITEGIFKVEVNREGDIVLPKIGVVKVAGLNYGDFKPFIEDQLGKYYESVNVGITIAELRTIRVYVVGEVVQPGSYSISSLSTVYSAMFAAGGPTKNGSMRNIQLRRGNRVVANVDLYSFLLKGDKSQDWTLQSGDTIFVPIIGPVVGIAGAVYRPGIYEIKGTADLADLIYLAGGFMPTSYLNRVQVKRIEAHEKRVVRDENISASRAAKRIGFTVQNMDLVEVLPIVEEATNLVYLEGDVKYPGNYEFKAGMKVGDILSGEEIYTDGAYAPQIEIIRTDPATKKSTVSLVDPKKLNNGDASQNIELKPLDRISVTAERIELGKITLSGEVLRPGVYTFVPGEKLSSVLTRAGGFTGKAYLYGAKFVRQSVKDVQEKRAEQLHSRLEEEIAIKEREAESSIRGGQAEAAAKAQLEKSQKIMTLVKARLPEGRIVITLSQPIESFADTENDIELIDGDFLDIPTVPNVVIVLGEVFNPNSFIYSGNKNVKDYLKKVGGVTNNGDKGAMYIIRADGSVTSGRHTNILSAKLMPGDAIIVPQIIETANVWATLSDFTRWLYEAVVTFSLIQSLIK